ncbi:hypothetical protein [Sphingomonas xinjiangensis]|uniref:Amino acid transporter n=1 Tax=Sphingomonas xinjiangensis TaxID=643568 RepID=A0A840YB99_9SPHN|nr:hypothetical protein [Sphingomonas xinjiangensis]MBB5709309.1 amino acid transporter [Sphingomonas xinjiangensis]
MQVGIAILGLLAAILGPLATLAYKSDRKWPAFYASAWPLLVGCFAIFCCLGLGAAFVLAWPKEGGPFIAAAAVAGVGSLALVVALVFADWVRDGQEKQESGGKRRRNTTDPHQR